MVERRSRNTLDPSLAPGDASFEAESGFPGLGYVAGTGQHIGIVDTPTALSASIRVYTDRRTGYLLYASSKLVQRSHCI